MSNTLRDEEVGREEEGQERAAQLKHVHFEEPGSDDEEEEEEAVTEVHSLENATWRDMRVGHESAGELFERVQTHRWPTMPAFSFGSILGGGVGLNSGDGANVDEGGANSWWPSISGISSARRLWMVLGGVAVAVFIAVALRGGGDDAEGSNSPLSAGTPRHRADDGQGAGINFRQNPLRRRLEDVADTALAQGLTLPMYTTFEVVRSVAPDGVDGQHGSGMDFIVSVISKEALEAKAAVAIPPSTAASKDPFDSRVRDPRMTVEELPPGHLLVLNRFNTMRNHALIITKDFQSQEEALTEADFSAWYFVVEALPAVGFYNSAVEAGASQRHKHMQVIPDDALWDYRPTAAEAIPVDEPISRLVGSSRDLSRAWKLPEFGFQHVFTLLPTLEELRATTGSESAEDTDLARMAAHLRNRYLQLLGEVGFDTSALLRQSGDIGDEAAAAAVPSSTLPPYNAILTPRWMMIVPRSQREWGGIDVNGMGFLGALLVREKAFEGEGAGVEAVRGPGALAVLEGVTFRGA